jgi:hypothetical protein
MTSVVALRYPIGGMAMICLCLIVCLSPPHRVPHVNSSHLNTQKDYFHGRIEDCTDFRTRSWSLGGRLELAEGDRSAWGCWDKGDSRSDPANKRFGRRSSLGPLP